MSADEMALDDDVTEYLLEQSLYAFAGRQRRLLLIGFHRRVGSSIPTLAAALEHGLADEVLLAVYPVLLGTGKSFFANELVSTKAMPAGIILSLYKAARPLKTG